MFSFLFGACDRKNYSYQHSAPVQFRRSSNGRVTLSLSQKELLIHFRLSSESHCHRRNYLSSSDWVQGAESHCPYHRKLLRLLQKIHPVKKIFSIFFKVFCNFSMFFIVWLSTYLEFILKDHGVHIAGLVVGIYGVSSSKKCINKSFKEKFKFL